MIHVIYVCSFYNLKTVSEIFLKPCNNVKGYNKIICKMHFIFDRVIALDVSAVAGHGAVLAVLLFYYWYSSPRQT